MTLNENELKVLKACADNALDAAGGDFGFGDEIKDYIDDMSNHQIAGYLSQLKSKDMIYIDGFMTADLSGTQITFPEGKCGGLKALLDSKLVDEAYNEDFDCWHY